MKKTLGEMQKYLATGQGAGQERDKLQPVVRAYLTSILLPASQGAISACSRAAYEFLGWLAELVFLWCSDP